MTDTSTAVGTMSARRWQLWIEYLLAKADHDEVTATRKLDELMETIS